MLVLISLHVEVVLFTRKTKEHTGRTVLTAGEGGYFQIIRLSRALAELLCIDDWKDKDYFPVCSLPVKTIDPTATPAELKRDEILTDFNSSSWFSPQVEYDKLPTYFVQFGQTNVGEGKQGVYGVKLQWSHRNYCWTRLHQTWSYDITPFTPYSSENLTYYTKNYSRNRNHHINTPSYKDPPCVDDVDYVDISFVYVLKISTYQQ